MVLGVVLEFNGLVYVAIPSAAVACVLVVVVSFSVLLVFSVEFSGDLDSLVENAFVEAFDEVLVVEAFDVVLVEVEAAFADSFVEVAFVDSFVGV